MTKDTTLRKLLADFLPEFLEECRGYGEHHPMYMRQETRFVFKDGRYSTDHQKPMPDYVEFLSRVKVKKLITDSVDFGYIRDIVTSYDHVEEYMADVETLMDVFILNYLEDVKSFEFNRMEFGKKFKEMMKFIKSDIHQVHYFTPVFNISSPHNITGMSVGDMTLNRINANQFKIIKEHMVGRNSSTPAFMYTLQYVLEVAVMRQDNLVAENDSASKRFQSFVEAALLFGSGDIRIGPMYRNFTRWTKNSSTVIGADRQKNGPRRYVLRRSTKNKLYNFYTNYFGLDLTTSDWSFIRVAIDRFVSSVNRDNQVDRMVDLNVSLECLFSSAGETSMKIANRTAALMGDEDEKKESCWRFIRDEYKLRNEILHGRKDVGKLNIETTDRLERIVRTCLCKFLNMAASTSRRELKEQHLLRSGDSVRDYVLDELDLGLHNGAKMRKFLAKTVGVFTSAS